MPRFGSISPKQDKILKGKLAVLRGTRAQKGQMTAFDRKEKDEDGMKNALIHGGEINHPANQSKKGAIGSVSKGGGIGMAEKQFNANEINKPGYRKAWPKGGGMSSGNPATGNTRMKGPVAKSGGIYGGGGRGTQ